MHLQLQIENSEFIFIFPSHLTEIHVNEFARHENLPLFPQRGSTLCRCLESSSKMVCLWVASSIPASFSSPSVTFSKPWGETAHRSYETIWHLDIKSHVHVPPDHNTLSPVSLCTGTGHSLSATRQWSDYSCLNSRERRDLDCIPWPHACTCIPTGVSERRTHGGRSPAALLETRNSRVQNKQACWSM